ncbi:hypothetical protein RJ641_015864 [Dillenia turbinata]|uniref:Uncharacterized protein n=1 Tax=Dillenia turbinata TaxID=194707 RepID=A0AAN8UQB2_9MAGN
MKQSFGAYKGFYMAKEDPKDPLKGLDWKAIGEAAKENPGSSPVVKKRLPKKMREIPEYYFLPRRSIHSTILLYGTCIAAGVGAGMLVEVWIKKKVKDLVVFDAGEEDFIGDPLLGIGVGQT